MSEDVIIIIVGGCFFVLFILGIIGGIRFLNRFDKWKRKLENHDHTQSP